MGFSTLRLCGWIAALMALAALAARHLDAPRVLVSCALGALACSALLRNTLQQIYKLQRQPVQEQPVGLPASNPTRQDHLVQLEGRLEHTPVALFVCPSGSAHPTPLNNFARRMLAPGRATNPDEFGARLRAVQSTQRNVISFDTERGQERALVAVNNLHINGAEEKLIAVLPIESELETVAFNAWQQLVHVLTHEIMNSLTPVASLSRTAHDLLGELHARRGTDDPASREISQDLATALDAIGRRSDSLVGFVSSYRSLTNLPAPLPERVVLAQLFARISALMTPGWQARGGSAAFVVEPSTLEILIDGGQLEQAIINLIKNAAEATHHSAAPTLSVQARLTRGNRLRIEINDNGPGVPDELIGQIFTPFFTTKTKGSGIGLAMVRQLVHNNGGTVRYVKVASTGARFILMF